jgi:hypothetical protein
MAMRRNDVAGALGGLALALVIAVGVVAVRHDRAQEAAPAVRPLPPPEPGGVDRLSDAVAELAARLDAQEGRMTRAEDRALPVEARLEAVEAALAGADHVDDALKRVRRELDTVAPATGAEAERLSQLRPRLKELGERTVRMGERLEAIAAQLGADGRGKRTDSP